MRGKLITPAEQMVTRIMNKLAKADPPAGPETVRKALREGYKNFCKRVEFGETTSGYRAWRRASRRAQGLEVKQKPGRKPEADKADPRQQEMF